MGAFSDFYTKQLDIYAAGTGYLDSAGIWHDGKPTKVKTILCDIQPYTRELAYRDFGFEIECTKRVFCDIDSALQAQTLVGYNGAFFTVSKLIEWDDYYDILLEDYKGGGIIG